MSAVVSDRPVVTLPLWRMTAASVLPPAKRDAAMSGWIRRLPLGGVLLTQAVLTLRLSNSAFDDEGLYIDAGHAYIAHLLHGTPVPDFGSYFSGAPMAYPVLAGALDSVGGLWLVRLASLLAMMLATLSIWGITRHLWNKRAADLSAAAFVLAGPVAFLGAFATFDAFSASLLAVAAYVGVTRRSSRSAVIVGGALALAVICKYTAAAFVPVVLALVAVASVAAHRRPDGSSGITRALLIGTVAVAIPLDLYSAFGATLRAGITFTTSGRQALSPVPTSKLMHFLALDVGLVATLAVLGAVLATRSIHSLTIVICLMAGAALLPVAQMRLGEEVSFEKHLAYSAVFLAPLAGRGLLWILSHKFGGILVFVVLFAVATTGLSRSHAMYQIWPPVENVLRLVKQDGHKGQYFSTSARTLGYYTRNDYPGIHWDEQYGLYGGGNNAIRQVVTDRKYEMIVLRSRYTGAAGDDAHTAYFIKLLDASPYYELVAPPFQTRPYAPDRWLVYRLATPTGPGQSDARPAAAGAEGVTSGQSAPRQFEAAQETDQLLVRH
jgi:Dolichyl-phosphate-mannose-protein mannosyltransferase